jgi:hypothetical protein
MESVAGRFGVDTAISERPDLSNSERDLGNSESDQENEAVVTVVAKRASICDKVKRSEK